MLGVIKFFTLLMVMVCCYQFYRYTLSYSGKEKQDRCLSLGVSFTTLGITGLVFRTPVFVFGGLLLIMFGLRLIAHGHDRIDKTIYIDRYRDHDQDE